MIERLRTAKLHFYWYEIFFTSISGMKSVFTTTYLCKNAAVLIRTQIV